MADQAINPPMMRDFAKLVFESNGFPPIQPWQEKILLTMLDAPRPVDPWIRLDPFPAAVVIGMDIGYGPDLTAVHFKNTHFVLPEMPRGFSRKQLARMFALNEWLDPLPRPSRGWARHVRRQKAKRK